MQVFLLIIFLDLFRFVFDAISYLIKELEFEFGLFFNIFEVMGFTWILFRVLSIKTSKTKKLKKHQHFGGLIVFALFLIVIFFSTKVIHVQSG